MEGENTPDVDRDHDQRRDSDDVSEHRRQRWPGSSGGTAIGVTLAFNTIGYESQNVLFNAIDALIGDPAIANASGLENPSNATATLLDTTVNASGLLMVSAVSGVTLTSGITNTSTASTTSGDEGLGVEGGQDLSLGLVLAIEQGQQRRHARASPVTATSTPRTCRVRRSRRRAVCR